MVILSTPPILLFPPSVIAELVAVTLVILCPPASLTILIGVVVFSTAAKILSVVPVLTRSPFKIER